MKWKKCLGLMLAAALLCVTVLSGCAKQQTSVGGDGTTVLQTTKVKLAAARDTQLAPVIMCAVEKGFFKEVGIDAELVLFASGADLVAAVASGDVDLGSAGDTPATSLLTSDPGKYEFIARTTNLGGALSLVVREGINTPQDLIGKNIGYSVGNTSEALWQALVKETGIDADQVTLTALGAADMLTAFETKQIDGFVCWEPTVTNGVKLGGHRLLTGTKSYFNGVEADWECLNSYALLCGSVEWIEAHPDTVTAVLTAMQKSSEWIDANLEDAAAIVGAQLSIELDDCISMMERNEYGLSVSDTLMTDLTNSAKFLYGGGKIPFVPDFKEMFDGSYLKAVDESLVTVTE
ncbi:MAG: ABC transporter substrate-binding protein [Clostridia bacterium]|nr:ABC transporter substrate-binding protein [Clostridia bacterium]